MTGFAIVNRLYYKATSPDMLLLPFMSVTQDSMTVIPTLHSQYLRNYLKKKRDMATSASNTDEETEQIQVVPFQIHKNKFWTIMRN